MAGRADQQLLRTPRSEGERSATPYAAAREELGLDVASPSLLLPAFRYRAEMADGPVENEMCPVLLAICSDPAAALRPDPAEVGETEWVDWESFRHDVLTRPARSARGAYCRWPSSPLRSPR